MTYSRTSHTAALLTNNMVLVAGGLDIIYGFCFPLAELFNPATGAWTGTGSMNQGRLSHTATLLTNGMVLVVGGYDYNGHCLSGAELYNPATETWTNTGSMNQARLNHTATLLTNGMVLVAGGDGIVGDPISSAELYNPVTGTWTNTGSMNQTRDLHTATLLPSGMVLVTGGNGEGFEGAEIYTGISHLVCNPRTAWVVFVIFCLLPGFARHFSSPPLVFARRGRCFDAIVGSKAHFLPTVKTPPPWLPWFSCNSFHFSSSGCCCW